MISLTIDATDEFNATGVYNFDLSGWNYAVVQLVTPATAVSFKGTNDSNAITGIGDGNAYTAINWTAVQLTDLSSGTAVTSSAGAGNFKYDAGTKFLQLSGTTAAKIIMYLSKIQ